MSLTAAELVDARRFAGYPPVPVAPPGVDACSLALSTLTPELEAVVRTFVGQLRTLEAAIPAVGDNLDTDRAAVWTHNKAELRDRDELYLLVRRRFCAALGIPTGAWLAGAMPPAVFAV